MKRALLISAAVLLFVISSSLRGSYSYTNLYGPGSMVTTGRWTAPFGLTGEAFDGEVAATVVVSSGSTDLEWGAMMVGVSSGGISVQQWRCLSGCGGYEVDGTASLGFASASVHDGSTIRIVQGYNGQFGVYVDNVLAMSLPSAGAGYLYTISNNSGNNPPSWFAGTSYPSPNVNLGYEGGGGGITWLGYGSPDTTAPNPVSGVTAPPYYNHVDLQWPATPDDPNGTGIYEYQVLRGGSLMATIPATASLAWSDTTVVPNSTYTYTINAIDYHFNSSSSAPLAVTTLPIPGKPPYPSAIPDGREVGVRPTGTYWGASGENIDVRSGNLNFALPLLKPQGRGSWSVPFNLIYNSQNWRQDSTTWIFNGDVGYGWGWRLMAGSLTTNLAPGGLSIDHFLYTDSTGAEYRLDQNSGNIWGSKESIYVWFDANTNILHFRDGSFWLMGCVSETTEADAGVMYPTVMEDTNGNQILIRYNSAPGARWTNSSARISQIEDVRAVNPGGGTYYTYAFTYNTDSPPHLTSISNTIYTGENYSFSYAENQGLYSPFDGSRQGTVALLSGATISNIGTSYGFTYDSAAELTKVVLPYKGYLRYDYNKVTYPDGMTYRMVQNRYFSMDGVTEDQYKFNWCSLGTDFVTCTSLVEPSVNAGKIWYFSNSGASLGLTGLYAAVDASTWTVRLQNIFTWSQNASGNSYISSTNTTLDRDQSYNTQKQTNQTVDAYGNVTQVVYYNWGNLSTPYLTENFGYLNSSAYTSAYIYNRMTSSPTISIQYDQGYLASVSGMREWDSSVATGYGAARGNPTTVTGPSGTTTMSYNIAGAPATVTVNGVTTSVSTTGTTNYAAPSLMTVGSLSETMNYNSFLGLTNDSGPNGASVTIGYDANARPNSVTSPFGGVTGTAYNDTASPPTVVTSVNGRWTRQTLDGLGRTILTETGYGNTTVSQAETVYGPCGCSPLGKMIQQAVPHAPGTGAAYTTYSYDSIGRTTKIVAPDGASTTTYIYQGNTVTVIDPAGKWKTFTTDALGNLVQVNEPNPGSVGALWYDGSWAHRKQIAINHAQVSGSSSLTNFPVLISLGSDSNLAASAQANGNDILFTAGDGLTKLNHEIEGYASSNGQLIAWVQVPSLSNSGDTVIFMYYGNASAANQQNPSGVWDINYAAVYHLAPNGGALGAQDSTVAPSNGTVTSATSAAGEIGWGGNFSGSSQYVDIGNPSKLQITGDLTIEAWVKPTDYSNYNGIVSKSNRNLPGPYDWYLVKGSGVPVLYRGNGSVYAWVVATGAPAAGQWSHVAATMSGTAVAHYLNGSANGSGTLSTTIADAGTDAMIASRNDLNTMFKGGMDEVRISNIARSAGWIATEYNNQSSPGTFFSIGGDQTFSGSGSGPGGYVTTYGYDILGHVTGVSMTRPAGSGNVTQTRSFSYSGNLLMSATNPENGTVTYSYNSYRKVASRTDTMGQVVVYSYDSYARLTKVQRYPHGTSNAEDTCQQENYYYDSNPFDASYSQYVLGRLAAVQYNACSSRTFIEMYSYSVAGGVVGKRLRISQTQQWYADANGGNPAPSTMNADLNATFGYDNEGRMISEQYPLSGPNMALTYDSRGHLYSEQDQNAGNAGVPGALYYPAGQLQSMSGGGGFAGQSFIYNAMQQLTQVSGGGRNIQYNYSANQNNGKIVSQTDLVSGETVSYTYDALNRLATAVSNSSSAPWGQSFTYDGFGNLTNVNVISGSAPILSATYDPATNHGYCSDANGNGMSAGTCAFTPGTYLYDVENRVTTSLPSGNAVQGNAGYAYAPGNKRVWRGAGTYNSSTSSWSTDEVTFWAPSGQKLATYQLTAVLGCYYAGSQQCGGSPPPPQFYASQTGTYYYFGGRMVKNAQGWVYPDRLGSIGKFYPYGTERPSATTNGTEKFTGYLRDAETGLDYADQRYEQPGMGRFLTPDPYVASATPSDPGGWNRYAYVAGDPINFTDPDGLFAHCPDGTHSNGSVCLIDDPGPPPFNKNLPKPVVHSGGGGGVGGPAPPPQQPCNPSGNSTTQNKISFILDSYSAAYSEATAITGAVGSSAISAGALATMFVQWSMWESGYNSPTFAQSVAQNNYFGMQQGWQGSVSCPPATRTSPLILRMPASRRV
jgi:RHS repeat-associated protein